jgi:hypothetical protein
VARYAEWREVEPPPLGAKIRDAFQRVPLLVWLASLGIILPLVTWMVVVRLPSESSRGELAIRVFVALLCIPLVLFLWRSPSVPLRRLVQKQPDAHPVKLTLTRNGDELGQDEGVVHFSEGALIYEGVLTSFKLSRADVFLPGTRASGNLEYVSRIGKRAWAFVLVAHPEVRVTFEPAPLEGRPDIKRPLYDWLHHSQPAAVGDTVLPPIWASESSLKHLLAPRFFWAQAALCAFLAVNMMLNRSKPDTVLMALFFAMSIVMLGLGVLASRDRARVLAPRNDGP